MTELEIHGEARDSVESTSEMAAEHALLGLLAANERGAGHGYDLARRFEEDQPLGNVIRLEPGMVYHHLKKLERLGWVSTRHDLATGRAARRVFVLTDAGRQELTRWMTEPVARTREIRLEFLVKLFFALGQDCQWAARLVAEQREMCARLVESLARQAVEGRGCGDVVARRFADLVLDMRLAQTQAALAWLDRIERDALNEGERVMG
jgi:DNA-binding PadR family transcriptional regulator